MRKAYVRFGALFVFVFLALPLSSHAALLYFEPSEVSVYRGDTVTLALRLDTDEGECINTVDAVISYGEGVRAVDVSRGDSILNLWVEDPKINETDRTITFAGGITGGYCGRAAGDPSLTNVIAHIVFQSPGFTVGGGGDNRTALVEVTDQSSILLNDGFGTPSDLRRESTNITLLSTPGSERTDTWREEVATDTIPPSDFAITLSQDTTAFSGQHFISWNTQDKQSGIDHYEVMEEPLEDFYAFRWGRADAPWIETESPYVLQDQTLNSTIRVKAIDKAGNETIAVLVPDDALRTVSKERAITLGVTGVIFILLIGVVVYVLMERKRRLLASYSDNESK
jgi:hypothetical protein